MDINTEPTYEPSNSAKAMKLNNGFIWFLCFVPLLGLFFENYAVSRTAGIFLWIMVLLFMLAATAADYVQLKNAQLDVRRLTAWLWLTPVYIYKREKLCGYELYKAIMCGFFIVAALALNGFTQSIRIDEDYMTVSAQSSYVQSLDNFSGSSGKIIGDCIESYLGENAEWNCTKDGYNWTVTVNGSHRNSDYSISFLIVYDGFTYRSFKISDVTKDGKSLSDDDFTNVCKEIFIDTDTDNGSSDNSDKTSS